MTRRLWRLAWPLAIMLQLVALSDALVVFWLGHMLGSAALAVEATLRHVFMSAGWVMVGVATGVSVLVAQSVGAGDGRGMALIRNGVALALVLWVVAVAIALPLSGPIAEALASRDVDAALVREYAIPWMLVALSGIGVVQVLLQAANGAGWTRISLMRSIADLALTAALIPILVHGFGIAGAPLAVGAIQLVIAAVVWRALVRHRDELRLGSAGGPRFDRRIWRDVLAIGMPPQLARVAMQGSYAYLVQRVALDGPAAVAAYGISILLVFVTMNVGAAIGRATAIVVGQSIGAKARDSVHLAIRSGLGLAVAIAVVLAGALALFGGELARLFTDRADVIAHAEDALVVLAFVVPCVAVSQVFLFAMTAMKKSLLASVTGIAADAIGIAFALAMPGDSQLAVVAWSIVLSNAVRAAVYAGLWYGVLRTQIDRRLG